MPETSRDLNARFDVSRVDSTLGGWRRLIRMPSRARSSGVLRISTVAQVGSGERDHAARGLGVMGDRDGDRPGQSGMRSWRHECAVDFYFRSGRPLFEETIENEIGFRKNQEPTGLHVETVDQPMFGRCMGISRAGRADCRGVSEGQVQRARRSSSFGWLRRHA